MNRREKEKDNQIGWLILIISVLASIIRITSC